MKIKKDTIIRTVILLVAIINNFLVIFGYNTLPFTDSDITELVSGGFTMVAATIAWWKNNSFTKKAIAADYYKTTLSKEDEQWQQ